MNRLPISIPWSSVRGWLPSRGNVLFTLVVLASLFFAGRTGRAPSPGPGPVPQARAPA